MGDITLCIGDAHVEPGQSLTRFKWAGRLIKDIKPDRVIPIGDFVSFDSLSKWDRDKRKKMELRRYKKDLDAGRTALDLLRGESGKHWANVSRIYVEGNHENRVPRYLDSDPTFEGAINVHKDLCPDWTWVAYKTDYTYNGVSFTHVPHNEGGKAIGGANGTTKALSIYHNSVVYGHTHNLDIACVHRHNSPHLNQAINVGCFFENVAEYAQGSVTSYWRGLVVLNHTGFNRVDISTISLSRLKKEYGDAPSKSS